MEQNEGISPATPSEGKSELEPVVGTLGVKVTLRGTGERPTLADLTESLEQWNVGDGLVVKVTDIEWR